MVQATERGVSRHGLENHGVRPSGVVHWNQTAPTLYEDAIKRGDFRYTAVGGTAYPIDLYTNVQVTARHFLRNVRPGAILVLHDGGARRASSIRVLAVLLPRLREMGYRVVSLGELCRLGQAPDTTFPNGPLPG